jgi:peptidoglycan/LPS O-acetylase OafA/YrhL
VGGAREEGAPVPAADSPASSSLPRADSLTGLRWWAAFVVFAHHIGGLAPLPGPLAAVAHYGYLGVTFFFVLSGFVLTWSWSARLSTATFYWRRFARVYPAHVIALLVAIPVFTSFTPQPDQPWKLPVDILALLLALFLLQAWSADPAIFFAGNPVAWTLTYEAFFYAMHPLLTRGLARLRVTGALIASLMIVVLAFAIRTAVIAPGGSLIPWVPSPVQHLTEFALGMALAWAFRSGWRPRIPVSVGLLAIALAIAAIVALPRLLPGAPLTVVVGWFPNELVTVACALAIVALAARSLRGRRSFFSHPILVRLGEWSFAFYLLHETVIYALLGWVGPQPGGWTGLLWFSGVLAVSIAAAAALHLLVEKPAERRIRGWRDRRDARRRVAGPRSAAPSARG